MHGAEGALGEWTALNDRKRSTYRYTTQIAEHVINVVAAEGESEVDRAFTDAGHWREILDRRTGGTH